MSNEYPQERYTFDVVSEGSQSDHQHLEEMEWEAEGTMSLMDTCTPRQRNRDFYKALSDARISSIIRKQEEKGAKCPPAPGGSESRGERIYRFVPFTFTYGVRALSKIPRRGHKFTFNKSFKLSL